jgi:hypothetical protein
MVLIWKRHRLKLKHLQFARDFLGKKSIEPEQMKRVKELDGLKTEQSASQSSSARSVELHGLIQV